MTGSADRLTQRRAGARVPLPLRDNPLRLMRPNFEARQPKLAP